MATRGSSRDELVPHTSPVRRGIQMPRLRVAQLQCALSLSLSRVCVCVQRSAWRRSGRTGIARASSASAARRCSPPASTRRCALSSALCSARRLLLQLVTSACTVEMNTRTWPSCAAPRRAANHWHCTALSELTCHRRAARGQAVLREALLSRALRSQRWAPAAAATFLYLYEYVLYLLLIKPH